jgi:hypothetical protein
VEGVVAAARLHIGIVGHDSPPVVKETSQAHLGAAQQALARIRVERAVEPCDVAER